MCAKFEQAFVAPLLGDSGASLRTLAQLRAEQPKRLLCFDKLLVGGSFDSGSHHTTVRTSTPVPAPSLSSAGST